MLNPGMPPPPSDDEMDRRFRPSHVSLICLLVAAVGFTFFYVPLVNPDATVPYMIGGVIGATLTLGLIAGIFAVITRRVLRQSNNTANIVFALGAFGWAALSLMGHYRAQEAKAAPPSAPVISALGPAISADVPSIETPQQHAAGARSTFLAAQKFPQEKSAAEMLVALNREGKPWQWVDGRIDVASPEFKRAYQLWRQAEIRAGNDPKVTATELTAITKLHDVRTAIEKFRATHNNRPPTLRAIAALPPNPVTGSKTVARTGEATKAHGWSYDEATGKVRIVLPPKKYAGLHPGEIEWPRISK